jgi:hypothetical protein
MAAICGLSCGSEFRYSAARLHVVETAVEHEDEEGVVFTGTSGHEGATTVLL